MTERLICDYIRSPIRRFGGALFCVRRDDLVALPLRALPLSALPVRHPRLSWQAVDDVILGCANHSGEDNRKLARMMAFLAGLTVSVPGSTVLRRCGSGIDAVLIAAAQSCRALALIGIGAGPGIALAMGRV